MVQDEVEVELAAARSPRRRALAVLAFGAVVVGLFAGYHGWQASRTYAMVVRLSGEGCRPKVTYEYGEPPDVEKVDVGGVDVGVRLPMSTRELALTRDAMLTLHAVGGECSHLECELVVEERGILKRRAPREVECSLWDARRAHLWP